MSAKKSAFKPLDMGNASAALLIMIISAVSAVGLLPILVVLGVIGAVSVLLLPVIIWAGSSLIVMGIGYAIGMEPRYALLAGIGTGFLAFIAVQTMGVSILSVSGMSVGASQLSTVPMSLFIVSVIVGVLAWLKLYETTQ